MFAYKERNKMKLNIKRYVKNLSVDVIESKNSIFVSLLQNQSTPGIFLEPLFLRKGQYEVVIDSNASRQNVFCFHLYDEYKTQRVIKNKRKMLEDRYENIVSFEVLKDDIYLPVILGTECQIGDSIHIYDVDLRKKEYSIDQIDNMDMLDIVSSTIEDKGYDKLQSSVSSIVPINNVVEKPLIMKEKNPKILFFDNGSKFGVGTFISNLQKIVDLELLNSYESFEEHLSQGFDVYTNGYLKKTQDLAIEYPKQIHCFWHSSLLGVELMAETTRYTKFLMDIKKEIVNAYFLNQNEIIPINGKRFWLPFDIDRKEKASSIHKFDFAIPLGSPHSLACKNILSGIMFLLEHNYSFILPQWYKTYFDIDTLKNSIGSQSHFQYFDTIKNPIEKEYFQAAKFYLAISTTDTMPYSCIESLNSGTPILLFKNVGWSSLVGFDCIYVLDNFDELHTFSKHYMNESYVRDSIFQEQVNAFSKISQSNKNKMKTIILESNNKKIDNKYTTNKFEIASLDESFLKSFLELSNEYDFCRIEDLDLVYDDFEKNYGINMTCVFATNPEDSFFDIKDVKRKFDKLLNMTTKNDSNFVWEIANAISMFFDILVKDKKNIDLENHIFLAIDVKNWAFHNISKQILKHSALSKSKSLLIVEYLYLQVLMAAFDIETNVVCFWWNSISTLEKYSQKSKYVLMVYDHYSWVGNKSKSLLVEICQKNNVIGVGVANNKLRKDMKKIGIDKPLFVVKDGVDFEMFPLKQKENDEFVFGWIGNSKIQASAGYDKKDLKGLSIIKSAIQSTNQNVLIWDVSEKDILPQSEIFEKFYNHIDCYICMSNCEGTPNTVFESLTCGIPTITTDVGNVEDVLIDGVNGFIIDRDEESLIKAMSDVLRLKNFFRNNRQEIRNSTIDFEWSKRTKQWDLLLNVFQG